MIDAYEQGRRAESILDNPYWLEYPRPAKNPDEELSARRFVDGFVDALKRALGGV